jgi:hypothetical protein
LIIAAAADWPRNPAEKVAAGRLQTGNLLFSLLGAETIPARITDINAQGMTLIQQREQHPVITLGEQHRLCTVRQRYFFRYPLHLLSAGGTTGKVAIAYHLLALDHGFHANPVAVNHFTPAATLILQARLSSVQHNQAITNAAPLITGVAQLGTDHRVTAAIDFLKALQALVLRHGFCEIGNGATLIGFVHGLGRHGCQRFLKIFLRRYRRRRLVTAGYRNQSEAEQQHPFRTIHNSHLPGSLIEKTKHSPSHGPTTSSTGRITAIGHNSATAVVLAHGAKELLGPEPMLVRQAFIQTIQRSTITRQLLGE